MEMFLTDAAAQSLRQSLSEEDVLWIHYDSEGCGCAVSGVAALTVLPRQQLPAEPYIEASLLQSASPQPIIMLKRHAVFFDEQMTLDFREDTKGFVLKSSGQIYGNDLTLQSAGTAQNI
ncbi:hypothetical protein DUZ99_11370 [Xylanibacillus composti]|uniref:Core domain-containing protein n=1 Tax=Xylanibacillus composti TaxID=1572762 RepID=A0A8J4GYU6_9BACL|nr:iron-sulfur cluster biosynthesis family protein [Xylanibacillus composti]MDT9725571.1 hypothetical protein [Xylanibacillus composti]GIQ67664.1 hypothetical protein XYCOK13_04880 [Xylanibacillus composti]